MALLQRVGAFKRAAIIVRKDFAFAPELLQQTNLCTPSNTSSPYEGRSRGCTWKRSHMAIYRLLRKGVFEPDDVRLLATVYEKILGAVGVVDRKDPRAELVAKKVVQLAQAGERDPECLKELAIEELQQSRDIASNP
jgi:hypothetical protein